MFKEKFDNYIKNDIPWYMYIKNSTYILIYITENNKIHYNTAKDSYTSLISFPKNKKEYSNPEELLLEEMKDNSAIAGAIYQNIDNQGKFKIIASKNLD